MAEILCDSRDGSYGLAVRGARAFGGIAIQADAPLARVVGFAPVSLTVGDVVTMTSCRFFAWPKMTTRALLFRRAGVEALQIRAGLCVLRVDG